MLQHVTLEVPIDRIERACRFWEVVGFVRVPPPPSLGGRFVWFERRGTQIHLARVEGPPRLPDEGHVAVVASDFEATLARLAEAGFEVTPGREHWGARRAKTSFPPGHVVELMESPPTRSG